MSVPLNFKQNLIVKPLSFINVPLSYFYSKLALYNSTVEYLWNLEQIGTKAYLVSKVPENWS